MHHCIIGYKGVGRPNCRLGVEAPLWGLGCHMAVIDATGDEDSRRNPPTIVGGICDAKTSSFSKDQESALLILKIT